MLFLLFLIVAVLYGVTMQITKSRSNSSPYASQDNELAYAQGWVEEAETRTWTFVSANAGGNTFVVSVNEDITSFMRPSLRVRAKQGGDYLYFIVQAVELDTTNTLITLFGGTDFDLSAGNVTNVAWSPERFPFGFPASESKWIIEVVDTTSYSQASPGFEVVYNLGGLSITIPRGLWKICYFATLVTNNSVVVDFWMTLSTSNSVFTDASDSETLTQLFSSTATSFTGIMQGSAFLDISTDTTLYLVVLTESTMATEIKVHGSFKTTVIRAVSAYY